METDSLYTVKNLQINPLLMQEPSRLGFRKGDGSEDQNIAEKFKDAFQAKNYTLNPNVTKRTNFINYYTDLVSQVGNTGFMFRSIFENQEGALESIEGSRQQVVGVSSDEELSNMIKFQNAYNLASKMISILNECYDRLITQTGV